MRHVVSTSALVMFVLGMVVPNAWGSFRISGDDADSGLAIVIPADAAEQVDFAAEELQKFLKEIVGYALPIKKESGEVKEKCIRLRGIHPDPQSALGKEGYSIEIRDNQLIITGGLPRGIVYGVYSFLEDHLGCRWFAPDCQRVAKREEIVLPDIDETYVPPLSYRDTNYAAADSPEWSLRRKLNGASSPYNPKGGNVHRYHINWHSLTNYLSWDARRSDKDMSWGKVFEEHPEYGALVNGKRVENGQVCFTNPDVRRMIGREALRRIRDLRILSVSQNEGPLYCQCDQCQAVAKREGSQSGPLLDLVNYVADEVAKEYPDKYILTLAYQWSIQPPAHMRPRPNVIVQLCTIRGAFNHPMTDPMNAYTQGTFKEWAGKCDTLFVWDYVHNSAHLMAPHPNLHVIAPNIRFYLENGAKGIFEQTVAMPNKVAFAELKAYLVAKALWNPDVDADEVVDDFLDGYYGPAAPLLREYIDGIHGLASKPSFHMGVFCGCICSSPACKENHTLPPRWAPDATRKFVALFDEAEGRVSDDEAILRRVQRARLSLMYKRICGEYLNAGAGTNHDPNMTHEEFRKLVDRFVEIARRESVLRTSELNYASSGTLENWLDGLEKWYAQQNADTFGK